MSVPHVVLFRAWDLHAPPPVADESLAGSASPLAWLGTAVPRAVSAVLVVVTSAAVLVLEVLAVRLVAPYVGMTIQSYTAAIGVALLGIAAGARLGGLAADRHPPRRWLGGVLVVAGLLVLTVRPLVHLLGPAVRGQGAAAAVLLVALSTLAPVVALSAVPPGVVKARLASLDETGTVVGRFSALGTLGALAGTIGTGFLLVATMPTSAVLAVTAAVLVVLGVVATPAVLGRLPSTLAAAALLGTALVVVDGPCEVETPYFCARVLADDGPDGRAGGRVLVLDNLRHAYVDLDDPAHLELAYTQWIGAAVEVVAPAGEPLDALHVGGGGFTLPRWLAATRPGSRSTVLELDPAVVELARAELGLRTGPDLAVFTGDARTSVADLPDGSYDVVVGDAFGSVAVPWHLTTVEFVAEVDRVLRPDGAYVMNIIDRGPLDFLRAELATLRTSFPHLAVLHRPGAVDGSGGNLVVVASQAELPLQELEARAARLTDPAAMLAGEALGELIGDAPVLTDDFAPVDQLLTT